LKCFERIHDSIIPPGRPPALVGIGNVLPRLHLRLLPESHFGASRPKRQRPERRGSLPAGRKKTGLRTANR